MMKRLWILICGMAMCGGCGSVSVVQRTQAGVRMECVAGREARIMAVRAYEVAQGLRITGQVRRTADNCCDRTQGQVQIALVDPHGRVIDTIRTSHTPRSIPKTRGARFDVTLPYVPTETFTLQIRFQPQNGLNS